MKPVCSLLALVVTLLLLTATSGNSDTVMTITAVLGHSVTFRCPQNHRDPVDAFYIQKVTNHKEEVFVNGFYKSRPTYVSPEYQDRTTMKKTDLSMEMRNISVSDEGLYKCIFLIKRKSEISKILLKVTAEYSIPTVTTNCSERKHGDGGAGKSCELSCSAVGGYPQSTVTWAGLNPSLTSIVYNGSSADNESKTWTINQTIVYNCDQPTDVSCAVGGAVSDTITICNSDTVMTITAVLGHSVTFRCPQNHRDPVDALYIQKVINHNRGDFVNGFYKSRLTDVSPEYQDRTTMKKTDLSMEMRNISVSDEGLYKCIVLIKRKSEISKILLKVTAEYSIPTVATNCSERKLGDDGAGKSCELSCSAVGGYPQSTVTWAGLNPSLTSIVYNGSSADNESKTWTINQTIVYNCDQPTDVSCAVRGAVSDTITIC